MESSAEEAMTLRDAVGIVGGYLQCQKKIRSCLGHCSECPYYFKTAQFLEAIERLRMVAFLTLKEDNETERT